MEKTRSNTNPSSLTIHMYGANVICQIRAGAEASMAVVPTTVISNAFCRGGRNSLSIHHNRSWTPTGNCAVYIHNSAAYAARQKKSSYLLHFNRINKNCSSLGFCFRYIKTGWKANLTHYLLWFITLSIINVQSGNSYYYSTV